MSAVESEILETQQKFECIMKEETKTQQQILSETKDTFDNDADFLSFDDIKKPMLQKSDN